LSRRLRTDGTPLGTEPRPRARRCSGCYRGHIEAVPTVRGTGRRAGEQGEEGPDDGGVAAVGASRWASAVTYRHAVVHQCDHLHMTFQMNPHARYFSPSSWRPPPHRCVTLPRAKTTAGERRLLEGRCGAYVNGRALSTWWSKRAADAYTGAGVDGGQPTQMVAGPPRWRPRLWG
jgi:hypothetical protein